MGFTDACGVGIEGDEVVFVADEGVFRARMGHLPTAIADLTTLVADGNGRSFTRFNCRVALDGGIVAFGGETSGAGGTKRGVYVAVDGRIVPILRIGDTVEDERVGSVAISDDQSMSSVPGEDQRRLTRIVLGNTGAVYLATVETGP
jgi:hypothetical protein